MAPATFQPVPMPAGIKDLRNAKVMLITDGGLVPKGQSRQDPRLGGNTLGFV